MQKKVLDIGQCDPDHYQIKSLLSSLGAQVVRAHTAVETIEQLSKEKFDLLLVNRIFDMDGDSGIDLIGKLKADQRFKDLNVMLVSNFEDAQKTAISKGAIKGFGKASLGSSGTMEYIRSTLDLTQK